MKIGSNTVWLFGGTQSYGAQSCEKLNHVMIGHVSPLDAKVGVIRNPQRMTNLQTLGLG